MAAFLRAELIAEDVTDKSFDIYLITIYVCRYFNERRRADGDNAVRIDANNYSNINDRSTSRREQLCINTL